ncbi:hypothetical protein [Nitrosopumilus sp.]|uniref:hypothetical protein n=1 Tax=Nitrosopumilus sp. TaxID=2024843 RepID=UPI00247D9614|nr:hypothetical protein [Nitrosopumilus sp.]MCV0430911.1 hypothetical protein [Nitrosopumilus sp.]
MNLFSKQFKKILFLIPLILFSNFAYADDTEIEMDWIIEGQINDQSVTTKESEIISNYEDLLEEENIKSKKPIYDKFVTNNQYAIGDYKITIDSEDGQILNGIIIEQRDLQQESFKHKIKYYDRFSDGYIEIAEALLDPIGDSKYLINGRSLDYNPNSNLELFVLERGYSMDDLEAIPNDIFTPKEFTLGREILDEAMRSGTGEFDLREFSPNYLQLNKEQIQERMMESFSEQTSQIFNEIIVGKQLQPDGTLSDIGVVSEHKDDLQSIFDNFKFEQSKFENTRHVRHSLQDSSQQVLPSTQNIEGNSLLIIPIFVALAIFGYLMRRKLFKPKQELPPLEIDTPRVDYRELTNQMLINSQRLYDNHQRKYAYEVLSQAIRYYYSQNLQIYKEMTNFELLSHLKQTKSDDYELVKRWLLLCGSVEFAKYKSHDNDYQNIFSEFSKLIN